MENFTASNSEVSNSNVSNEEVSMENMENSEVSVESTVKVTMTAQDPDNKLLEGIDFSDREVMAKRAELEAAKVRIESFQKGIAVNEARVIELETELSTADTGVDRRTEALAKVSVMRSCGMVDEAIRAALKQQYGMIKPNANRPLTPPNAKQADQHTKVRKLSAEGQERVLQIVRAAGASGIGKAGILNVLEKEGVEVKDDKDISAVLRNAVLDGLAVATGLTKGTVYSYVGE